MMRTCLASAALAASSVLAVDLSAARVQASCLTPCAVQLCAGTAAGLPDDMPSIVTATHDPAMPGVVIVEGVLRSGSGPIPQPGDQLSAIEPITASHLLVYASTPAAWFPIGDDGFVRCAYFEADQLPPQAHGATPQTIASLAGTATCTDQLSRAGYPIPPCNDTPRSGAGCQVGSTRSRSSRDLAIPLAVALAGALTTLAGTGSRRRRARKKMPVALTCRKARMRERRRNPGS